MSRLVVKLVGLLLLIAGVYFLGENIVFASSFYYFWGDIPAAGAILCLMAGVLSLLYFRRETGSFGWVLIGIGIVLVFLSGGVFLRPTSLWTFLMSFTALTIGYKLLTRGRVSF